MELADLTSGDLARATGQTVRTIRFYEEQGLLRPASVSDGGHRRYGGEALERLRLILDLRELGLSLQDIGALLALRAGCRSGAEFASRLREVIPSHIAQARRRIDQLRRLEGELRRALKTLDVVPQEPPMACACAVASQGGAPRIVRVLAKDGVCPHEPAGEAAIVRGKDEGDSELVYRGA
ncbi:MAG TPA: MerR family transcriptional regulator [Anaeromyxobacteraceae bacterium]|nr:MerR family transcriptional regulator [Anaeromyxobacteraceae bacterium]